MKKTIPLLLGIMLSMNVHSIELSSAGLVVEASEGENTIYVTNTTNQEILVYAKEETEETKLISGESLFHVSPPVSKVMPFQKQLIRVILKKKKFETQKLGRVLIQEIPYIQDPNANQVSFAKSYNIPVLVHPEKLVESFKPWENGVLKDSGERSLLVNNSNYLIKLMPTYKCVGNGTEVQESFESSYLMPKAQFKLNRKCSTITVRPVSNEGQILEEYKIVRND